MHRWIKKRNKTSGTDSGRATRDGEVKEWKGKDEGCGEGGREGGCQQMVATDMLYESIFPPRGSPLCLKAQLVHPSDNKTTSIES